MKEYRIGKNDSGQRLNKFLEKAVPLLPAGLMHKYLRRKRIKVNGKRTEQAYRLQENDIVQLYLNDEFFTPIQVEDAWRHVAAPRLSIVYEDENLLLVDKRPGLVVHADNRGNTADTLIAQIQAYLYQSGSWNPDDAASFAPALCNRIDRNTGGIVIAAKTAAALRILSEKIRNREIVKEYLCIVHGRPSPAAGRIENYLRKDSKRNQVTVHSSPVPGGKTAITCYQTIDTRQDGLSLVACRLITGRTHQIRAHMAFLGHPLLGDGKYGRNTMNRPYGETAQALYSYRLHFSFQTESGELAYLDGKEFTVSQIDFVQKYFPQCAPARIHTDF